MHMAVVKRTLWRTAAVTAAAAAGLWLPAAQALAETMPAQADYQAIAHPVAGRVGQTVEVELGVRNGGPGPAEAARAYEVTAPQGTTIVSPAGQQPCAAVSGGGRAYRCAIAAGFGSGERETVRFRVHIDAQVPDAEGWVRIVDPAGDPAPDPDPDNDAAPILVEVQGDAPVASDVEPAAEAASGTLLLATASGTALSAGAIALGAARRREN